MTSIELSASELRDLVSPVLPLASSDATLPVLNSVLLQVRGDYITATATDRYRLGIQRFKFDEPPAEFTALVSVRDLRHMLTIFKPNKAIDMRLLLTTGDASGKPTITIEATAGLLTFSEARFTYHQVDAEYPKIRKILRDALAAEPGEDGNTMSVNPHFLADFKAAAPRNVPLRIRSIGPSKPIVVMAGDDFIGMLMCVKDITGDAWKRLANDETWHTLLGDSSPVPAKTEGAAA